MTGVVTGEGREFSFWMCVEIRGEDECWPWLGSTDPRTGYGHVNFDGVRTTAHRIAYILATGDVELDGLVVRHGCDNPVCCNPRHLSKATQLENLADMHTKGRTGDCRNFGEQSGVCKLTIEQVGEICRLYSTGRFSQQELADRFGVRQNHISRIVRGEQRQFG